MKRQLRTILITAAICIGVLLLAFGSFLIYSKKEYQKNVSQTETLAESEADSTHVVVTTPAPDDMEIITETPTPSITETPTATPTPTDTTSADSNSSDVNNTSGNGTDSGASNSNNDSGNANSNNDGNSTNASENQTSNATQNQTANSLSNTPTASNGHIVAIDAGHQLKGNSDKEPLGPGSSEMKAKVTSGTTGRYTGVAEYVVNLDVALLLRDELESRGYQVVMIRETHDVDISNSERAAIANNSDAEIFIRIHCNGVDDSSVKGALTMAPTSSNPYVGGMASQCKKLSQNIIDEYCAATGFKNKGIQYVDNMSGINWCKIPVTIIEMGFMTNPDDDTMLVDPNMQVKMANGIANGVDSYFGL